MKPAVRLVDSSVNVVLIPVGALLRAKSLAFRRTQLFLTQKSGNSICQKESFLSKKNFDANKVAEIFEGCNMFAIRLSNVDTQKIAYIQKY